jgi:hypothetical protein
VRNNGHIERFAPVAEVASAAVQPNIGKTYCGGKEWSRVVERCGLKKAR